MAEDLHDGPLRHAGHRQVARRIVPQIMKREPDEPEALHQPREGAREHARVIADATAKVPGLEEEHTRVVEFIAHGQDAPAAYMPHVKKRKDEEAAQATRDAERARAAADMWHRAASQRGPVRSSCIHTRRE